jgi:hypothetical protein
VRLDGAAYTVAGRFKNRLLALLGNIIIEQKEHVRGNLTSLLDKEKNYNIVT